MPFSEVRPHAQDTRPRQEHIGMPALGLRPIANRRCRLPAAAALWPLKLTRTPSMPGWSFQVGNTAADCGLFSGTRPMTPKRLG